MNHQGKLSPEKPGRFNEVRGARNAITKTYRPDRQGRECRAPKGFARKYHLPFFASRPSYRTPRSNPMPNAAIPIETSGFNKFSNAYIA
jgi:hypothetical protein